MNGVIRFGVAMDASLLEQFDEHIHDRGYANRSEAIRDLVRAELAREAWKRGERIVVTLTVVYDHHVRELTERLNAIQHEYGSYVISTLHVHLNHHQCLEVIVARGPSKVLKRMADAILKTRGVLTGDISVAPSPPQES